MRGASLLPRSPFLLCNRRMEGWKEGSGRAPRGAWPWGGLRRSAEPGRGEPLAARPVGASAAGGAELPRYRFASLNACLFKSLPCLFSRSRAVEKCHPLQEGLPSSAVLPTASRGLFAAPSGPPVLPVVPGGQNPRGPPCSLPRPGTGRPVGEASPDPARLRAPPRAWVLGGCDTGGTGRDPCPHGRTRCGEGRARLSPDFQRDSGREQRGAR